MGWGYQLLGFYEWNGIKARLSPHLSRLGRSSGGISEALQLLALPCLWPSNLQIWMHTLPWSSAMVIFFCLIIQGFSECQAVRSSTLLNFGNHFMMWTITRQFNSDQRKLFQRSWTFRGSSFNDLFGMLSFHDLDHRGIWYVLNVPQFARVVLTK